MPVLQVIGDRPGAGKTCLIGALLSRLAGEGKVAGYYRPFSASPQADPDVAFFARHLPAVDSGAPAVPAPQPLARIPGPGPDLAEAVGQEIEDTVAGLEAATQLVLMEGPDLSPASGPPATLAGELSARLESRVLLVFRYAPGLTAAQVAQASISFGRRLAGIVINGVTRHRWGQAHKGLVAELKAQGLPVLGALPEDRAMLAVTVQQVADHLAGRFVQEQEPGGGDAWVERFLIGGNIMDSGSIYFGRLPNQAVITRAARPDIQLASLTPNTRCLVLTGGEDPTEYIQVEARQRDVPLILVPGDTLTTAAALDGLLARANPYSPHKLERFGQLMQEHLELGTLLHGV
ncbi:MAG TPA: DRTGG domain-containing protein [Dehalococcoidia bacterium]|nr:DRTGG domain-containing protein [Dehalococcoidia bacterium]